MWPFINFLRSFFLKEEVHIGQVSESGSLDSRLHVCYSQIQLSILIYFYVWSLWSLISKMKHLYMKEMQDFLQLDFSGWTSVQTREKAIKCLCNQWGKVWNYYFPPCLQPRMFYNLSVWEYVCTSQTNSCSLQHRFVPDRHLQGWALLQSLTLIFEVFLVVVCWGIFPH